MRTRNFITAIVLMSINLILAQDKTTVNAMSSDISDNLDLRAVASIFGDATNLEDFENKLNNPEYQISNLDLNNDNQVDYLRVIESVENNMHLVVVQSVIGEDVYQDIATIEVERAANNQLQVQVVGDVYMYGQNYIYEPVYATVPVIYNYFWAPNYVPYYSVWRWRHYPRFYSYWNPFPVFKYRSRIGLFININHHYNYVSTRRCQTVYNNYYGRRANGYEVLYPNRSFERRNVGYSNRAELDNTRPQRVVEPRNANTRLNNATRDANAVSRGGNREVNSPTRDTNVETRGGNTRNENTRATETPRNTTRPMENSPSETRQPRSTNTRNQNNNTRETITPRGTRSEVRDTPKNNRVKETRETRSSSSNARGDNSRRR